MKALRTIAAILALGALAVCLIAPLRVFLGKPAGVYASDFDAFVKWFNIATIVWFVCAPLWLIPDVFSRKKIKQDQ
jgi:hypothetical protein